MMMKCIPERKAFNCSEIFTAAYADHTHHVVPSPKKHSYMVSTGPQPRMMRWRLLPNAGNVSFSRSKLQNMQILFGLSISLGLS
jgi:hypothetical protein